MRRSRATLALAVAFAASASFAQPAPAQFTDPATLKPGRDPKQPLDDEYTKKIKEYTTESFFLSPLVDYMPARAGVPTPKAALGDVAGAPGKLPYSATLLVRRGSCPTLRKCTTTCAGSREQFRAE